MQELFTLSQNGNEQALSTLLDQAFSNKGITVQCYCYDTCLYIVLLSAEAPQQSYCINLINNELNHLRTKLIKTVQVYGRQNNQSDHLWTQTFELDELPHSRRSFTETWFNKGRQQPEAKAKKHTANLSLLLSFISWFLFGTSGLVAKAQPDVVIDNTPNTETSVDLQKLFTETKNQFVISTSPDKFNSKGKPDTSASAEEDNKSVSKLEKFEAKPLSSKQPKLAEKAKSAEKNNKSVSKSEKSAQQVETKPSSSKQPKLAEKAKSAEKNNKSVSKSEKSTQQDETKPSSSKQPKLAEKAKSAEKNNKSVSKSEKSTQQDETKPSSSKQPKLAEKAKSAEKNNKSVSKSEKSTQQDETKTLSSKQPKVAEKLKSVKKGKKSFYKSRKSANPSKTKSSKAKSAEVKNLKKKNEVGKKSSNYTPKIKPKSDASSELKTESLTTKPVSKSSPSATSSIDTSLEKKASKPKQTTQPFEAKPNKSSVTPQPNTKSSKTEKSTDTSETANKSSKTKPISKSLSKNNSEATKQKLKPNSADKSSQNKKSPNDLPAADKSSQPNSAWTPPSQEKSGENPEPLPLAPSNTPKAAKTSTPKSTSQPSSPEKQPEKDAVKDSSQSQSNEIPSTEQKPVTTAPENSDKKAISNPKSSKNDGYITIKAVGDIVPGTNFPNNRLPDKNKIFEKVKTSLDGADLLFGNFESTFTNYSQSAKDTSRPMVFAFRTPPAFANVFKKTGFDILSVANNHSLDFSQVGFSDTMKNINSTGMKAVGKKNEIVYKQVKNIPIAFIGFSFLDVHNSLNDLEAAKALVVEAKQNAKIVVISFHGGAEGTDAMRVKNQQENFYGENRGNLVLFARTMIDNGADLVLGHGPHVVRAMELYKGKMIAYSLGNFVGYRTLSTEGDLAKSMVLQVKLNSKGNFVSGKILPVILDKQGLPYPDKQLRTVKLISKLTKSDFPNTDLAISRKGEIYKRFRTYRFFTLDFEGKPSPKSQA